MSWFIWILIVWGVVLLALIVIGSCGSNSSANHFDDRNNFDNGINNIIDWMI